MKRSSILTVALLLCAPFATSNASINSEYKIKYLELKKHIDDIKVKSSTSFELKDDEEIEKTTYTYSFDTDDAKTAFENYKSIRKKQDIKNLSIAAITGLAIGAINASIDKFNGADKILKVLVATDSKGKVTKQATGMMTNGSILRIASLSLIAGFIQNKVMNTNNHYSLPELKHFDKENNVVRNSVMTAIGSLLGYIATEVMVKSKPTKTIEVPFKSIS